MNTLVCCFSLIAVAAGLMLIAQVGRNIAANSPEVLDELKLDTKKILPNIVFWAPLGAIFGALGAIVLMRFVGIPLREATGWVILGVLSGGLWGSLWGIIFGLTERQK